MSTPKMTMMTREEIRTELGWTDSLIHSLLQAPDSDTIRRCKTTGGYTRGLYKRERVLAVAQSKQGMAAKRRWDETLRGFIPNPRLDNTLGNIGRALGITAVATGRILEQLGYRSDKQVTDEAVAAGCGVRRWDGFAMHDDWHLDRVVSAIRSAAEIPGKPAVADALAAAIARQEARERVARKREQEETEAARRQEEEAEISGLRDELRALCANDPGISLLTGWNSSLLTLPTGLPFTDVVVLWSRADPVAWVRRPQSFEDRLGGRQGPRLPTTPRYGRRVSGSGGMKT